MSCFDDDDPFDFTGEETTNNQVLLDIDAADPTEDEQ